MAVPSESRWSNRNPSCGVIGRPSPSGSPVRPARRPMRSSLDADWLPSRRRCVTHASGAPGGSRGQGLACLFRCQAYSRESISRVQAVTSRADVTGGVTSCSKGAQLVCAGLRCAAGPAVPRHSGRATQRIEISVFLFSCSVSFRPRRAAPKVKAATSGRLGLAGAMLEPPDWRPCGVHGPVCGASASAGLKSKPPTPAAGTLLKRVKRHPRPRHGHAAQRPRTAGRSPDRHRHSHSSFAGSCL